MTDPGSDRLTEIKPRAGDAKNVSAYSCPRACDIVLVLNHTIHAESLFSRRGVGPNGRPRSTTCFPNYYYDIVATQVHTAAWRISSLPGAAAYGRYVTSSNENYVLISMIRRRL